MSNAPINANWIELQAFYRKLAIELHNHGVNSLTTGGIACVLYELVQSTKDCDIIIPVTKVEAVMDVLTSSEFSGCRCHLTLKYGAPLASKWLRGGWSSHTFFGPPSQPLARVDLFGRPPRVSALVPDEDPLYLSRGGVAQMKKTRREKDWAFANLLGAQMLEQGNIAGVLHVTNQALLREAVGHAELPQNFITERPLLRLALNGDPDLNRYLKAEKEFWTRLDDLRLSAYEKAWKPYGSTIEQESNLLELDLRTQNQKLIAIAEEILDPEPLRTIGWHNLVSQAKEETVGIFHDIDLVLLPSPQAFLAESENK